MSQFSIHSNLNPASNKLYPYLINVQASLLDNLETRLVIPLSLKSKFANKPIKVLNPIINIVNHGTKPNLSSDVRAVVFRIAQEAITNVVRHSNASKIDVQLDYLDDNIYLRVEDNGQGFNTDVVLKKKPGKPTAWGLLGMVERASLVGGTCNIFSHPGKGTLIEVNVPIIGESKND